MNETLDQFDGAPAPKPKMPLGRAVLINFGVMVLYMAGSGLAFKGNNEEALGSLIIDSFLVVIQCGLNLLAGIILLFTAQKELGKALLISGLIVGIIGFGACFGKAALVDSI